MVSHEDPGVIAESVDPAHFVAALVKSGWRLVGEREGVYNRFAPPGEASERYSNIVVPLDAHAPDYADQMSIALSAVRLTVGSDWPRIQALLSRVPSDQ